MSALVVIISILLGFLIFNYLLVSIYVGTFDDICRHEYFIISSVFCLKVDTNPITELIIQ